MGKCFDMAKEKFVTVDSYVINEELLQSFSKVCDTIDALCDEFDFNNLNVSIDYATLDIKISVLCDGIEIDTRKYDMPGKDNKLLVIMKVANRIVYTNIDKGDTLKIEFSFPRIWEKSEGR